MEKMCTFLIPANILQQHVLPYSYLMTVLSFATTFIHHHHNEQKEGKDLSGVGPSSNVSCSIEISLYNVRICCRLECVLL